MVHSDFLDIAEAPAISMTLHYLPVLEGRAMSGCFEIATIRVAFGRCCQHSN